MSKSSNNCDRYLYFLNDVEEVLCQIYCNEDQIPHDENLPRIRVEFAASLSKRLIANSRRDLVVTSRRLAAIPWRGSVEFAVTDRESVVIHCEFVAGFDADSW